MLWFRHMRKLKEDHIEVQRQLDQHQRELVDIARRLRNLEIEAGIFKPPLKMGSD